MRRTMAAVVGALAVLGAGCASYSNVNAAGTGSVKSPNARVPSDVVREAVRWVVSRYPAEGRFVVNLPEGTSEPIAAMVLRALPAGAETVGPDNADLPTYHVGRVWIRSGEAKVDIIRPVFEMGAGPDGAYPTQAVTVHMEGGLAPWRVTLMQRWAVGAVEPPAIHQIGVGAIAAEPLEEAPAADETPQEADEARAEVDEPLVGLSGGG